MVNTDDISTDDIITVLNDIVATKPEETSESLIFDILMGLTPKTLEILRDTANDF